MSHVAGRFQRLVVAGRLNDDNKRYELVVSVNSLRDGGEKEREGERGREREILVLRTIEQRIDFCTLVLSLETISGLA